LSTQYNHVYDVNAGDYANAGKASRGVKKVLVQLGINAELIRKIAVASYEAEINLIIHSVGGAMDVTIDSKSVTIIAKDNGPGIDDVGLAMTEGYSTASDAIREMGFGAGMGLPNMRMNADGFSITSTPGVGTRITMRFDI
jgi:anti-sigma regulatory factor (Ser/Thr protein kinase)